MPISFYLFKTEVKQWFQDNVPTHKRLLDVGPGIGTYADLLESESYNIDAVEIYSPYIYKYGLIKKYDNVYCKDILEFSIVDYDFIILGDVLEHLHKDQAIELIDKIIELGKDCLVAIPYEMEQGEHEGNIHETHHQLDLTPDVMTERYPKLKCIFSNEYYGYYTYIHMKLEKSYILYANASYSEIVTMAVKSINNVSNIPVIVYMINSDIKIKGAYKTIEWNLEGVHIEKNNYLDRNNSQIYKLLIQRPLIVADALDKHALTIAYIDSDTVVTKYIDTIFDYLPNEATHPYFVEGVYDYLFINGRGGVETRDDLHESLEHAACKLFNVDQSVRNKYRQSGYFVAGQNSRNFIDEWSWMCSHPAIVKNPQLYAPYHEETIMNVLLWKHNIHIGLPLMYINYKGKVDVSSFKFTGEVNHISEWVATPAKEEHLLAFHGEKDISIMQDTINQLSKKVLFIAPHLSTGGMPEFLLRRIKSLVGFNIYVVEWANYSDEYVVQKNQIREIVKNIYTLGEDKTELIDIIRNNKIDIVHIDEMSEHLGNGSAEVLNLLYANDRTWKIIETCHNISFSPDTEKKYHPEAYAFCTSYHLKTFKDTPSYKDVIEFPIEPVVNNLKSKVEAKYELGFDNNRKHVVNIGLWTKGKNQGEGVELARSFPNVDFHFVGNQAVNFSEYWEPIMKDVPSNVHIWGERSDTHLFMLAADVFMFNSTWECNPLVLREAISYNLPIIARNLPQYGNMFTKYIHAIENVGLSNIDDQLKKALDSKDVYEVPSNNTNITFGGNHKSLYNRVLNIDVMQNKIKEDFYVIQHFVGKPYLEIKGTSNKKFTVEMYDGEKLIYNNTIGVNSWIRLDREYYTAWKTIIKTEDGKVVYTKEFNLENERVYIAFDSSSLGDTIAWIPYVEEFRKKHKCKMIVSTYKNFLFENEYPELEFIKPGEVAPNLYAMYKIGWFYNTNKEPELPNTIPLQKTATNILGLSYVEIKPKIYKSGNKAHYKLVTIATNSTAGCKYWTREGWQDVINYLHKEGYIIKNVSLEDNPFDNCEPLQNKSLESTIEWITQSEFFIGLSSGLSWLAWALDKEVIMISNFTEESHEFKCYRVKDLSVCNSCWNKTEHTFDKGDWNWCPEHKNTPRHFECHRSIKSVQVIEKINLLISEKWFRF